MRVTTESGAGNGTPIGTAGSLAAGREPEIDAWEITSPSGLSRMAMLQMTEGFPPARNVLPLVLEP